MAHKHPAEALVASEDCSKELGDNESGAPTDRAATQIKTDHRGREKSIDKARNKTLKSADEASHMNPLPVSDCRAATSAKRLEAANQAYMTAQVTCRGATASLEHLASSSNNSTASDQGILICGSRYNNRSDGSQAAPINHPINMTPGARVHKSTCRYHKQHQCNPLKRPTNLCCNHQQRLMANNLTKLVSISDHHRSQNSTSGHYRTHCIHHSRRHLDSLEAEHQSKQSREPLVAIKRERDPVNDDDDNDDESERRGRKGRKRATTFGRVDLVKLDQQQPARATTKRTTMKFISQLYFLIHLSAILSLLLHHKNLVTTETWRLQRQSSATQAKRHSNNIDHLNETTTSQMPSYINQLPIPLMLSSSPGTISSFVPMTKPLDEPTSFSQQSPPRSRRTLPLVLVTPSTGADILVRLFGYQHASWAIHYFLAYLLCSSITMLFCLRLFRTRSRSKGSCHQVPTSGSAYWRHPGTLIGSQATAFNLRATSTTLGGFYYRTRLVGSISLGLIQLIVIGLDIAAKIDWLSPSSSTESSGNNKSRWPIYLPFLQFAFVSLLMQYILSKVAENNQLKTATGICDPRPDRIPIKGRSTKSQPLLLLRQSDSSSGGVINQSYHHQMAKENNGLSGLQNIALAHLLVTHILLWLMKLNSISLFQAIEQHPFVHLSTPNHYQSSHSHSRLPVSPPHQRLLSNNLTDSMTSLDPTESFADQQSDRINRSKQSTSTLSPTRHSDHSDTQNVRPEFNRTELEQILRTTRTPSSSVATSVALSDNVTQQVSRQQRQPPVESNQPEQKSERGLRSASPMERSAVPLPIQTNQTSGNESVLINRAHLASLFELAAKNVQRLQVSPNVSTSSHATTSITTTTTASPATTTSTTTFRPQFKSSIPKRTRTAFKQVQKPIILLSSTPSPRPPQTATTIASTTSTIMPPTTSAKTIAQTQSDVSKIIGLVAPRHKARVHFSRDEDYENLGRPDEDPGDYSTRLPTDVDFDESPKLNRKNPLVTDRPFPSVEGDPPPGTGGHLHTEPVTAGDDSGNRSTSESPSKNNNGSDDSEESELDLDSLLPVPNYASDNETGGEPEEQSSQMSVFKLPQRYWQTTKITKRSGILGGREALIMPTKTTSLSANQQDQLAEPSTNFAQQHESTFSDYLLPIIYQYHILVVAILFNMWLDSLRTKQRPISTSGIQAYQFNPRRRESVSSASGGSSSLDEQQVRDIRTISVGSDPATRTHQGRHRTKAGEWEDTVSICSNLTRSNSLRASSERLLWVSASGNQQYKVERSRQDHKSNNWDSRSIGSSLDSSSVGDRKQEALRPRGKSLALVAQQEPEPSSSACSVLFGLLVVSAALIVVLLGVELLTILNQCVTQLISILVCLVGLCLVWRWRSKSRAVVLLTRQQNISSMAYETNRRLLLSRKGAAYLTNPDDILLSGKISSSANGQQSGSSASDSIAQTIIDTNQQPMGNHRQCFHYLFLLAAYFCGVSISLNLGKQHSVQQLFPPQIMHFLQRKWLQATENGRGEPKGFPSFTGEPPGEGSFQNWGLFWSQSSLGGSEPLSPLVLFHVVLALKGLLLIIQVTLQTVLIRSSCSQRATRQLRQVYTFLMFSNLSLWAMDIYEQQQHLHRQDNLFANDASILVDGDRLKLITLEGFTQFACSIVTLSHLYHGLVFMQH